jgi:inner membrane protein
VFVFAHTGITLGAAELARWAWPDKGTEEGPAAAEVGSLPLVVVGASSRLSPPDRVGARLISQVTPKTLLWFYVVLLVGSLLPDFIDKPLGLLFPGSFVGGGRTIAHTGLFAAVLLFGAALLLWRRRTTLGFVLFYGVVMHSILDEMWQDPRALWWPWYGFSFPPGRSESFLEWLSGWAANIGNPQYYLPEVIGLLILLWFVARLLRQRSSPERQIET